MEQFFFHLELVKKCEFFEFFGGLDPRRGDLCLAYIGHHHLANEILFLITGHMYNYMYRWGIGHGLKDILKANKGPFRSQEHKGL